MFILSNFRKIIIFVVVFIFFVMFLFQSNKNDLTKIGVIGHFSGEYASYSVPMKNSIEMAFRERDPNGKKYELIFEDDGTDSSTAVSAVNKLIDIDKVNYIISAQGSGATSAIIPVVQDKRKILIITLASAPDLTKNKDYIFRSVPSDVYQGVVMVSYIKDVLKSKKVTGLYVNDPYGNGIRDIIENSFGNIGSELFKVGENDFRTSLLKLKNINPETLVIVARENEYPQILKQIRELEIKSNIIASETFKDENILNNSKESANGIVTFMMNSVDNDMFVSKYKNMFGVEPSAYSSYAYDGAIALINSIERVGNNVEKVKTNLKKEKFVGASGDVSFDKDGDREGLTYSIYKVEGEKFVNIK